ncbi:MAG: hypothetical protein PHT88_04850 [Candidatus Moranbacteria bacterium]|nr:hypothetical protein [Candidatus Moranbacteria bacterium]
MQAPALSQTGPVKGPGTSTSDSIPAKLSDGEFIIPAAVVKQYGKAFFEKLIGGQPAPKLNAKGVQKLSAGGFVVDELPFDETIEAQPVSPERQTFANRPGPETIEAAPVSAERQAFMERPASALNVKSIAKGIGKAGLLGLAAEGASRANQYRIGDNLKNGGFSEDSSRAKDAETALRMGAQGVYKGLTDLPGLYGAQGAYQGSPAQKTVDYLFAPKSGKQPLAAPALTTPTAYQTPPVIKPNLPALNATAIEAPDANGVYRGLNRNGNPAYSDQPLANTGIQTPEQVAARQGRAGVMQQQAGAAQLSQARNGTLTNPGQGNGIDGAPSQDFGGSSYSAPVYGDQIAQAKAELDRNVIDSHDSLGTVAAKSRRNKDLGNYINQLAGVQAHSSRNNGSVGATPPSRAPELARQAQQDDAAATQQGFDNKLAQDELDWKKSQPREIKNVQTEKLDTVDANNNPVQSLLERNAQGGWNTVTPSVQTSGPEQAAKRTQNAQAILQDPNATPAQKAAAQAWMQQNQPKR